MHRNIAAVDMSPFNVLLEELLTATKRMSVIESGTQWNPHRGIATPITVLKAVNWMMLNECEPCQWKTMRLAMLKKNRKPLGDPSAFRLICLLSAFSKLWEGMLRVRLVKEIDVKGGFSFDQYGFTIGHATLDAVQEVTAVANEAVSRTWRTLQISVILLLDTRNVFNSLP